MAVASKPRSLKPSPLIPSFRQWFLRHSLLVYGIILSALVLATLLLSTILVITPPETAVTKAKTDHTISVEAIDQFLNTLRRRTTPTVPSRNPFGPATVDTTGQAR